MELKGKGAIVVGASRGIGKAYALALAQAGAAVAVVGRTDRDRTGEQPRAATQGVSTGRRQTEGLLPGTIHQTAQEIGAAGGTALPVRCDIGKEVEVEAMARQVLKAFGQVDVLVNNAAIYPRYRKFLDISAAAWDQSMNVNARGPFLCCRAVLPTMMARRKGSIINITSAAAVRTTRASPVGRDILLYAVAKAALDRLTTWLAEELVEYDIAVNGLSPGTVKTEGQIDASPPDYDWKDFTWHDPTPEYLGPPLLYLAQQTARTFTGKIVRTDEFGKTWP